MSRTQSTMWKCLHANKGVMIHPRALFGSHLGSATLRKEGVKPQTSQILTSHRVNENRQTDSQFLRIWVRQSGVIGRPRTSDSRPSTFPGNKSFPQTIRATALRCTGPASPDGLFISSPAINHRRHVHRIGGFAITQLWTTLHYTGQYSASGITSVDDETLWGFHCYNGSYPQQYTRRIRSRTDERGASPRSPEFERSSNSRNADRFPAMFGRFRRFFVKIADKTTSVSGFLFRLGPQWKPIYMHRRKNTAKGVGSLDIHSSTHGAGTSFLLPNIGSLQYDAKLWVYKASITWGFI